jgi:hypothetical protein
MDGAPADTRESLPSLVAQLTSAVTGLNSHLERFETHGSSPLYCQDITKNDIDPLDIEQLQKEVLGGILTRMAKVIEEGNFGAVMTEDTNNTHGYYLVCWEPETYAAQEDTDEWAIGELVCDGTYLNPVGRARNWYIPGDGHVTVRVQHTVAADILLEKPSASVKLPSNCNQRDALSKGTRRLSYDSQLTIIDEIK